MNIHVLQDDSNKTILSEKKFSKECIRHCVRETRNIGSLEELLGKWRNKIFVANYYTNIVFACYLCCITREQYKL